MFLTPATDLTTTTHTYLFLSHIETSHSESFIRMSAFNISFTLTDLPFLSTLWLFLILCMNIKCLTLYFFLWWGSMGQNPPGRFWDLTCCMSLRILHMTLTQYDNKSPKYSLSSEPKAKRGPFVSDQSISNNKTLNVFLPEGPHSS